MHEAGRVLAAGFVLAGGRSTRMGADKALLQKGSETLLEYVATQVQGATGNVTIVADPARYAHLGFPVKPDAISGFGPAGGIATALEISDRDWNLIAACDMPEIDAPFLETLLALCRSEPRGCECIAPLGPSGPEPLCAVYHRSALAKIRLALKDNILKMRTIVALLETRLAPVPDTRRFRNVNTPADWPCR